MKGVDDLLQYAPDIAIGFYFSESIFIESNMEAQREGLELARFKPAENR
jgi:hypothetical protein